MTIRLIAVDIDDTLLKTDKSICPNAAEKLREAVNKGIHVVLATARRIRTVRPIADKLGITNQPVICADGALIMSAPYGEIWQSLTVPKEVAFAIAQAADAKNWEITVGTVDKTYYRQRQGQSLGHWQDDIYIVASHEASLQGDEPTRIYASDETSNKELVAFLNAGNYADKISIQQYYNPDNTVESVCVFPPFSNKGKGLAYVAERLGIPLEETLAIGDGSNDIAMFEIAGKSVAMGNARDAVKKYADFITASNDNNGLAEAIEKYVLT